MRLILVVLDVSHSSLRLDVLFYTTLGNNLTLALLNSSDIPLLPDYSSFNSSAYDSYCSRLNHACPTCSRYNYNDHQCVWSSNEPCPCTDSKFPYGVCLRGSCSCVPPDPAPTYSPPVCHQYCEESTLLANGTVVCRATPGAYCVPTTTEYDWRLFDVNNLNFSCFACSSLGVCQYSEDYCANPTPSFLQSPAARRRTPISSYSLPPGGVSSSMVLGIVLGIVAFVFFVGFSIIRGRQIVRGRRQAVLQNGMGPNVALAAARSNDKVAPGLLPQVFRLAGAALDPAVQATTFGPQCVICFDAAANAAISPCGHVLCWSCLSQVNFCPMCRAPVVAKILMQPTVITKLPEPPRRLRKAGMGACGSCGDHLMLIQTSLPCCHLFCDKPDCSAKATCPQCQGQIQSYLPLRWVTSEDSEASRLEASAKPGLEGNPASSILPTNSVTPGGPKREDTLTTTSTSTSSSDSDSDSAGSLPGPNEQWDRSEAGSNSDDELSEELSATPTSSSEHRRVPIRSQWRKAIAPPSGSSSSDSDWGTSSSENSESSMDRSVGFD